jgi:hypothetical protein
MNILDFPATVPYNLAICGADNQQLKYSSEREISSVPVLKQDLQKTGKCFTVIKKIAFKV